MSKRIHIVGAPRSGTTLMAELMVGSFQLDGYAPHEMSISLSRTGPWNCFVRSSPAMFYMSGRCWPSTGTFG